MDKMIERIHNALDEAGYTLPSWRIRIVSREMIRNRYGQVTDHAEYVVDTYKYRCRKPCQRLYLTINDVRQHLVMDKVRYADY
jgi:predicted ATP-dependent Lon-type protease